MVDYGLLPFTYVGFSNLLTYGLGGSKSSTIIKIRCSSLYLEIYTELKKFFRINYLEFLKKLHINSKTTISLHDQ